uniref:Endonuclease/exonuclease/phosphatase domain-containing protein n=1 Tax=Anopheles quadriannulatus TaxID=34691 RepID=A0A182XKK0_ANOQN
MNLAQKVVLLNTFLLSKLWFIASNIRTLCNIYAPSGSQRRAERETFFSHTLPFYLPFYAQEPIILAGDFNCVLKSKDATGGGDVSIAFENAINSLGLCDSWEVLRGNSVEFSFIARGSGSRIDRCDVTKPLSTIIRRICKLSPSQLTRYNPRGIKNSMEKVDKAKEILQHMDEMVGRMCQTRNKIFFRSKTNEKYNNFRLHQNVLQKQQNLSNENYLQQPYELKNINLLKGKMLALQGNFSHDFTRKNDIFIDGKSVFTFCLLERRLRQTNITKQTLFDLK